MRHSARCTPSLQGTMMGHALLCAVTEKRTWRVRRPNWGGRCRRVPSLTRCTINPRCCTWSTWQPSQRIPYFGSPYLPGSCDLISWNCVKRPCSTAVCSASAWLQLCSGKFACPAMQCVRDRYPALLNPANNTMHLFMWQRFLWDRRTTSWTIYIAWCPPENASPALVAAIACNTSSHSGSSPSELQKTHPISLIADTSHANCHITPGNCTWIYLHIGNVQITPSNRVLG